MRGGAPPFNLSPYFREVPLQLACPKTTRWAQSEKPPDLQAYTFRAPSYKPFSTPKANRRRAERFRWAKAVRREGGRKGSTLLRRTKVCRRRSCAGNAERKCISKTQKVPRSARRAEIRFSRCQGRVPQTVSEQEAYRFERSSGELERRPR